MSTIYTSSQIRTIPNVTVAKNSNILEDATVGNNLTVKGKIINEDLTWRLSEIEENLADEDLHTTTKEAKELVNQIKTLLEEGQITEITEMFEDFDLKGLQLATDSLKDFHAKINGVEDTEESLLTSNLKTNLEENITETNKNTIEVLSAVDAALGGRIDTLEGYINGVNGAETNTSKLKTEIKETIGEYTAKDGDTTVYGKMYAINDDLSNRISTTNDNVAEALTAAKNYTDTEIGKIDAAYNAADTALDTKIEDLTTTVGQPATTGENGEVIHNATGIFKVIVDYKTSIDKLDGTIDNLNEVVNSYKDHVETYTDETIGKIANDKISELVGTESTEESAATGVFARIEANESDIDDIKSVIGTEETNDETILKRINTVESSINTLNASNTTDGSIAKAISDATTTINARIEALEEHHDFTVTLKDDISSTGEQMYSFTVKAGTIYAAVSDTECEIYTDEAMQNKLCSVAANEQKLFKAKEDSTYYVKTNIEIY